MSFAPILGGLFLLLKQSDHYFALCNVIDEVNTVVQENLIAIRTVEAYVKSDYENEKFEKINQELRTLVKSFSLFSTQRTFISIYDVYNPFVFFSLEVK